MSLVSTVSAFEMAADALEKARRDLLAAFGLPNGAFTAGGTGGWLAGSKHRVHDVECVRGRRWRIEHGASNHNYLHVEDVGSIVAEGDVRRDCLGVVESARFTDDFGHVAMVVDADPEDRHCFVLVVLTGMLEDRP